MAEIDQQDSQDALNSSDSLCEDASFAEESNGVKKGRPLYIKKRRTRRGRGRKTQAHTLANMEAPQRSNLPSYASGKGSLLSIHVGDSEDQVKEEKTSLKEKAAGNRKINRFHPYGKDKGSGEKKGQSRNRVFISNIPYDMKWQAIKDLMRDKVGEVTYVELFKDAEGKSRGNGVVEFRDMEYVTKAVEVMNKQDLNGRPLNIKADPDGEHARRALQRGGSGGGPFPGGHGSDMGPGMMNIPPSIMNNPNIPPEIIGALRAGRLGTTIFVANLDFKVGWKKLKEVFCISGTVKRADIKEDKDGKSRGMGTVTFEQPIEAVQAISMFNGQFLFDRPMHVKMDDKSLPHDDFIDKTPQLPRGLGGIGMGLGPGGQPIAANQMSMGSGMGNMGPGGSGYGTSMESINSMSGFSGMNRMTGLGGVDEFRGSLGAGISGSMGGIGTSMGGIGTSMGGMGTGMGGMSSGMGDMFRGGMGSGIDRDFGRSEIGLNRGFGDSFGGMSGAMVGGFGGMGSSAMGPLGSGMNSGMSSVNSMAMGLGMDRMSSSFDRLGGLDRTMDMDRGFGGYGSAQLGGGSRDRGMSKGCQIFVRNLPFDLTWQKLKEKFNQCGRVMFAEIKMENGKSKGCGTVRFDCPETAEKACRLMNGMKINGREIDVRLDRNA
ncbi:myelin expression factor 2 L homeolog isoform X1 [Xenopus laevis]|uniref:Myelin expression factor 2 L homeolog isoform X1 n=1 Tax=Xenopus laevis TaxID=8355 RepID=A0A8J0US14_XENLA|nr:myelin expression factor 2 L homeolog isoform X1 [Xenopus laevis]